MFRHWKVGLSSFSAGVICACIFLYAFFRPTYKRAYHNGTMEVPPSVEQIDKINSEITSKAKRGSYLVAPTKWGYTVLGCYSGESEEPFEYVTHIVDEFFKDQGGVIIEE